MRRLLILLSVFLVFSCSLLSQKYYVCLRVCLNDDVKLINGSISANAGSEIICDYFLIPDTDKTVDVTTVSSDNENVIKITSIDFENKKIHALALSQGCAKITIETQSFYSSTTLSIYVY
jgi:hypothetical protein